MKALFSNSLSIYLSIYLSVACGSLFAQPGPVQFVEGTGCSGSNILQFCIFYYAADAALTPVDVTTVTTSGTASFGHQPALFQNFNNIQKMFFWFDSSLSGTVTITFEADQVYTVSEDLSDYQNYTPLDLSAISIDVQPDCGDSSGAFSIEFNENSLFSSSAYSVNDATFIVGSGGEFTDLSAGDYFVVIQDLLCPTISEIFDNPPVTVPDGSFTVDVTTVNPILNCTSSTSEASGFVSGSLEGEVTGGTGSFLTELFGTVNSVVHNGDFELQQLVTDGNALLITVDTESNCQVETEISVPSQTESIDISFNVVTGICMSGMGTWPPYVYSDGVVESAANSALLNFDYAWNDPASTVGTTLTYSDIAVYTVTATIEGESCQVTAEFDTADGVGALFIGDFNHDQTVNTTDLTAFLGTLGTVCSTPAFGCDGDFNGDGVVNINDLSSFMSLFNTFLDCGN